jgi:ATP-dependent RNA helicase RhlE
MNERPILTQFKDLGLADPILRALDAAGYDTPTPIQAKLIPHMLEGRDVVGIAQTGTGKTAAFVLPLLQEVAANKSAPQKRSCQTLIVTPTRELAAQIADNVGIYGKHIKHRCAVVVGGVKPNPQIRAMANGVDILVATPGRLLDHMSSGAIRIDKTTTVILDEADQMLDLGFLPAIRKIMSNLPRDRRTALLSATMPKQIRGLASDFLDNPVEITVTPNSKPIERIDQRVIHVPKRAKTALLLDLLGEMAYERAIIFTRTKHGADRVARQLDKGGFPAAAIHGNKSQNQRKRALAAFKDGTTGILVATDIAARGIDVDDVSHVVNFDLPNVPESYVHRIGRTARAGKEGVAIAFCDSEERSLLRDIEKLIKTSLPKENADAKYGDIAKEAEARAQANGGGTGGRGRGGRPGGRRSGGQGGQKRQGGNAQGAGSGGGEKSAKPNKNRRRRPNRNSSSASRG